MRRPTRPRIDFSVEVRGAGWANQRRRPVRGGEAGRDARRRHGAGAGSWSVNLPTSRELADEHREELLGLNLKPGDKIEHSKFGQGIVGEINGDEVTATFVDYGIKRLSLSFAPIKKVE